MSAPILTVGGVGKSFRTYRHETQRVLSWVGLGKDAVNERWVLRDISFTLHPGETLAIVGDNGAGKSTLLKILTGTLRPSAGAVSVNGSLAAILELGLGFNPDFTGRQNAFHAAGLMGHPADRIEAAMGDIERFAEIGSYFDQPVRVYSSGMQMRVAFAVVTAFRPDILIIDEALSVGDTYFQHKSTERIRQFRREGTALILVSHDKSAIQAICERVILLDGGVIAKDGPPSEVMDYYNALIASRMDVGAIEQVALESGGVQTTSGTGEATIHDIELLDRNGHPTETVEVGQPLELRVTARVHATIPRLVFGYAIKNRLGQLIYGTNTHYCDVPVEAPAVGEDIVFSTRFPANLGVGSYSITVALTGDEHHLTANYEWRDLAKIFSVTNVTRPLFEGLAHIQPEISAIRHAPAAEGDAAA